jgi:predicted MFS family arabinose efflux permease
MKQNKISVQVALFTIVRVVINTQYRMMYPLLPAFRDGLGVPIERLYAAMKYRAVAGAFGPFLASIADSRGRKTGVLFGLLLFIVGSAVVVFWPTYPGLVIALILTILGKVVFDPSIQSYLGDKVPYARRALVLGIIEMSWSGAFLLGVPLMGFLIARRGWLAPFPLLGILTILSLLAIWVLLPGDDAVARPSMLANFGTVLRSPAALAGLAVTFAISASNEMVNLVFGVWMEASFGLAVAALGAAATVIGLAELAGEGLVTALADRLGKTRAVAIGMWSINLCALLLPLLGKNVAGALVGLFLFFLAFEFTFVSVIPLMSEILPEARATLMAATIASASLGRAAAAQLAGPVFAWGFLASAVAAVLINMAGLLALRAVRIEGDM